MKGHFFLISWLAIPENLGLKKYVAMTHYDILHFFFRFAVNVKGLHIMCTPPFLLGGRLNFQPSFQKEGGLAEPQLFLFQFAVNVKSLHTLCIPPFLLGGLNFQPNFQKGGGEDLVGPQLLERVARKEGMTFFTGAMQFSHIKN